ncbi:MAG: hypothetical protein QOE52_908 [Mycobacterium sp.]|nr:hypothetical protein [Mycobacterium sp.]
MTTAPSDAPRAAPVFQLSWVDGPPTGWQLTGLQHEPTFLHIGPPPPSDLRLPRSATDADPRRAFDDWLVRTEFGLWWHEEAAQPGDKIFVLTNTPETWRIPWELLVSWLVHHFEHDEGSALPGLVRHRWVGFARGIGNPHPVATTQFDETLRVMILKGEPRGLDLDTEIALITWAWTDLDHEVAKRVSRPEVVSATRAALVAALNRVRPHVLWFAGHGGMSDGKAQLLFADATWVGADELAADFTAAEHTPMFAVFGACDSVWAGSHDADSGDAEASLFATLRAAGVTSVVGMQAPIGADAATHFAHELFSALAVGYSFSTALARARARLIDEDWSKPSNWRIDWAAPVQWTAGPAVAALDWGTADAARTQLIGTVLLREPSLFAEGYGELEMTEEPGDAQRARSWRATRTWVRGDHASSAVRSEFLRILHRMQATFPDTVLAVSMDGDASGNSLGRWADVAHGRIRPDEVPDEILHVLAQIRRNPQHGWALLAAAPNVCLAISDPPPANTTWFWGPLQPEVRPSLTLILSTRDPHAATGEWAIGTLELAAAPADLEAIVAAAPRLARALAALRIWIDPTLVDLRDIFDESQPAQLADWPRADEATVGLRGRIALSAEAREHVLTMMTPEQATEAHLDAAQMVWVMEPGEEPNRQILHHALSAGDHPLAGIYGSNLMGYYWELGRAQEVVATSARFAGIEQHLDVHAQLAAAEACSALHRMDDAERWLRRVDESVAPDPSSLEPAVRAAAQAVWSQVEKARGTDDSYNRALERIRAAGHIARDNGLDYRWRNYRQDEALILLHCYQRTADAVTMYSELAAEIRRLRELGPPGDLDRQLAVILRNHAEAIRKLDPDKRPTAERELREALDLVGRSQLPIRAEILYELAQTVALENEADTLDECLAVSRQIGYATMEIIASARLFWLTQEFSLAAWRPLETAMKALDDDGWVTRTLADGRLRAARKLATTDTAAAVEQLEANRAMFEDGSRVTAGQRDKTRIGRTYAGVAVLSADDAVWQAFLRRPWAAEWLHGRDAQNVWNDWGTD